MDSGLSRNSQMNLKLIQLAPDSSSPANREAIFSHLVAALIICLSSRDSSSIRRVKVRPVRTSKAGGSVRVRFVPVTPASTTAVCLYTVLRVLSNLERLSVQGSVSTSLLNKLTAFLILI
jgi:hypothetical protein